MEHPITIAIADLPGDFQARVIGTHIRMRYRMFVEMWTNSGKGFEGDGAAERRYRHEHERINGADNVRAR